MSSLIPRNLTEIEAVAGCTFACTCNTVAIFLRQLLKFQPFDWLIDIYLQTEGQGIHHKMVSLQPVPGFSPLLTQNISGLDMTERSHINEGRNSGSKKVDPMKCLEQYL